MKRDTRTYRNFKFWPTWKLKEVIEEPYFRGIDGHDYGPDIEEIKEVYYDRLNRLIERENELLIEAYEQEAA